MAGGVGSVGLAGGFGAAGAGSVGSEDVGSALGFGAGFGAAFLRALRVGFFGLKKSATNSMTLSSA